MCFFSPTDLETVRVGSLMRVASFGRPRVGPLSCDASRFKNNYFAEMCSGRGDFVLKARRLLYHSTLDSRVMKKKKKMLLLAGPARCELKCSVSTDRPRNSAMWVLDVCFFHRQTSKQCELGPCVLFSPADTKRCVLKCVVSVGRPRSGASWVLVCCFHRQTPNGVS